MSDEPVAVRDLSRLLRPRSIAVFGGNWAERVVEQSLKMGFAGEIWPVHPSRDEMHGRKCFRSIAELPGAPDASFVAVNRHQTLDVIADLAARGAGGAVCFASGFREVGPEGAELQARLVAAAGAMPVLGPNCYGLINTLDGALLWPDQHGAKRCERGVAVLTQSSNIGINLTMNQRGLPLAYLIALGNQAAVGLPDVIATLSADPRVTAIGLYVEGIADSAGFARAASLAHAAAKPIVVVKGGRTEIGAGLAMSHTGSLAGGDAAMDALFARLGIARVDSLPVLLETLKLLHVHGGLGGVDITSMSCSGGEALMMADAAARSGVCFRPFSPADIARIRPTVHDLVTVSNPFDYHTFDWANVPRLTATFSGVLASGFDLSVLVMDFPRQDRCNGYDWDISTGAYIDAAQAVKAPAAMLATLPECMPEAVAERLIAAGIAPLCGIDESLQAVAAAACIGRHQRQAKREIGSRAETPAVAALWPAHPMPLPGDVVALSEAEAKLLLREHAIPVADFGLVGNQDEARTLAARIGYPVVAKAVGRNILHKSELGAVRLNIADDEALASAVGELAPIGDAVLVEKMVAGGVAELILGINLDPVVGHYMVIGLGGVFTELMRDTATLLLPASREEILAAISGLKGAPLLTGYRGKPVADLDAVADTALALQAVVAAEAARLVELEINPLIVCAEGQGAFAVDALMRIRREFL